MNTRKQKVERGKRTVLLSVFCLLLLDLGAAEYPTPAERDFVLGDFQFNSGETLPEVRMHCLTLGSPRRDDAGIVRNAVLILHGTTGSSRQFLRDEFAGELYGKGQLLDATRYFVIIPDNVGHGESSKPSDGLRAKFPRYGYLDMIRAQHRLLVEGLGVNHLRLVFGTSMGGMHCWLWGELHPDFMDALMPMASLPKQISGRNRVWRRLIMDAIRTEPGWDNGNYKEQPPGMRIALEMSYFMGNNPVQRLKAAPTLAAADEALDRYVAERLPKVDANDYMYAFQASYDYDPGPGLERIRAPLLAINSADDLINPPELSVLEKEIKRVKHGKAIVLPLSDQTVGHGSHTKAVLWKKYLAQFLKETETKQNRMAASLMFQDSSTQTENQDPSAPKSFLVQMQTSKGPLAIEVRREWAPHGADRFYALVKSGYYDGARFFRIKPGYWAQFGINGDPRVSKVWRERMIPDDPRQLSNTRGTVAFAFAVPDGRTTQVFINLRDNRETHDPEPFVPFGRVISGMEVADALNAEYGERAGGGIRGGKQTPLFEGGNLYLKEHFPNLDYIERAVIVGAPSRTVSQSSTADQSAFSPNHISPINHQPKDHP